MTKDINKNDLIMFMLDKAMDQGIKCILEKNDPNIPCKADCDKKAVIIIGKIKKNYHLKLDM